MAIEVTGTRLTNRFLGKITAKCPNCGEAELVEVYEYFSAPGIVGAPCDAWVSCKRCHSSYVVEVKGKPEPVRERRR
uniref:Uncharacterized protein n=1 Tax=viral metagenome TaxID=1070528 RepID=A0A6M3L5G5_9ZZZZ